VIVAPTADRIVILGGWRPQSLAFGDPIRGCGDCPHQPPRMTCNDAVNADLRATNVSHPRMPAVRQRETVG
jgi:hypothetical protein